MARYAAFLRAVNVGGTGKLPMADLRAMCADVGFENAKTYIASGNVVFDWDGDASAAQEALAERLATYAGKPVGVMVRTAAEMADILAANPFADVPGNKAVVIMLNNPVEDLGSVKGQLREVIVPRGREIYLHYPDGQGRSKLSIPAASDGTARNMNTIAKIAEWVAPT